MVLKNIKECKVMTSNHKHTHLVY